MRKSIEDGAGTAIEITDELTVLQVMQEGGDKMVAASARVLHPDELAGFGDSPADRTTIERMIDYMMSHRHGTPFEPGTMTFYVDAPVFVWWQWVRHRIAHGFNLESARWHELRPLFWVPRPGRPVMKAAGFRPARPKLELQSDPAHAAVVESMSRAYLSAWREYAGMLAMGVASEVARSTLTFGSYYRGWVTVNPRSLMAFLSLRSPGPDPKFPSHPQHEIAEAAAMAEDLFKLGWPICQAAFRRHGSVGP